jgi:hypothetical protein
MIFALLHPPGTKGSAIRVFEELLALWTRDANSPIANLFICVIISVP